MLQGHFDSYYVVYMCRERRKYKINDSKREMEATLRTTRIMPNTLVSTRRRRFFLSRLTATTTRRGFKKDARARGAGAGGRTKEVQSVRCLIWLVVKSGS
jgi:hypothetical protein